MSNESKAGNKNTTIIPMEWAVLLVVCALGIGIVIHW